jgi:hypothetical protein
MRKIQQFTMDKKLTLISLINEMINEVGDLQNIVPYPYTLHQTGGDYEGRFKAEFEDKEYDVEAIVEHLGSVSDNSLKLPPVFNMDGDLYNIGYNVEGELAQFDKTNMSTLVKIIKTVIKVASEVMEEVDSKPPYNIFTIGSMSKEGVEGIEDVKLRYYKAILNHNLPTGYRMAEGKYLNYKVLALQKLK